MRLESKLAQDKGSDNKLGQISKKISATWYSKQPNEMPLSFYSQGFVTSYFSLTFLVLSKCRKVEIRKIPGWCCKIIGKNSRKTKIIFGLVNSIIELVMNGQVNY